MGTPASSVLLQALQPWRRLEQIKTPLLASSSAVESRYHLMEETNVGSKAVDLGQLAGLPMALEAAIELNVIEILANSAGRESKLLSSSQIVEQIPARNPKAAAVTLERILRFLASNSVLTSTRNEKGEMLYGLTPVCEYFLPNKDGVSLATLVTFANDKVMMQSWHHLKEAVLTEGSVPPFNIAHDGMNAFEYNARDERFNKLFNDAMFNHSTLVLRQVLENYKEFERLEEIVDVGGGIGASLKMITSRYPHIKGTNFDLPHVIAEAPPCPGVKHVAGDMFEGVPTGEAIFMKWILHDWDDERCKRVLKNCWRALPETGKVISVEFILPEDITNDPICRQIMYADLFMLAVNEGGKERTLVEFEGLAKESGFAAIRPFPCSGGLSVLEFHKKPLDD
ncbi:hypothetical protein H6P81_008351 [Aristolochia fimbriata]|uniref:Uncharacterized protein n=1 Tax=Aristolochia fimbriata TaxID=158543 RepID=A0AAV7F6N1_ARIFI|nr:hypothetical protein H6P81_008351 [Aristolochia fimbriata]